MRIVNARIIARRHGANTIPLGRGLAQRRRLVRARTTERVIVVSGVPERGVQVTGSDRNGTGETCEGRKYGCTYKKGNANAGKQRNTEGKSRPSPGVGARLASGVRRVGCGKTCTKYEARMGAATEDKVQRAKPRSVGRRTRDVWCALAVCVCFQA